MNDKNFVPFTDLPFEEYCKHDAEIVSIKFEFDSPMDIDHKIIFICKIGKFDKYKGFIEDEYFNLVFINPSYYSIFLKSPGQGFSKKEMENPSKIYDSIYPMTLDIIKKEITINHSYWEIIFGNRIGYKNESPSLIRVYANNLKVEKINKNS